MKIDTKPYKIFQKLKEKYPTKMVLVTDSDATQPGLRLMYRDHRDYITRLFQRQGVKVTRFAHNYKSLDGAHPELGLVFLANDSVIVPGLEVWALIGHNAVYERDDSGRKEG